MGCTVHLYHRLQEEGSRQGRLSTWPSLDSGMVAECRVGCGKELPPHLGSPQVTSGHTGSGPRPHPSLGVGGSHSPLCLNHRLSLCRWIDSAIPFVTSCFGQTQEPKDRVKSHWKQGTPSKGPRWDLDQGGLKRWVSELCLLSSPAPTWSVSIGERIPQCFELRPTLI